MHLASTRRAVLLGAVVLAVSGAAAACGDAAADPVPATDPAVPVTAAPTTSAPPPTVAPTTTTLAPITTTTLAPTTTTTLAPTTTTTLAATTTTSTSSTTTTVAGPPATAAPVHGGFSWAVYVGAWDRPPTEAELEEARALARAAGYDDIGGGDVGCDQGSADALGLDPAGSSFVAGLYFATEADARAAAATIGEGVRAVTQVQTYCLD